MDFRAELRLERLEESNCYVTGECVDDFGREEVGVVGDCAEEFDAVRAPPVREGDAFSRRKPRPVEVAADRLSGLVDGYRDVFIRKRVIQFF